MNNEFSYEGRDLETMAILLRYYRWILEMFSPYLSGHAVEFGAGQGTISEILLPRIDKLDLIEPSANLFEVLRQKFDGNERIALFDSTLEDHLKDAAPASRDVAILVNVLEHIEDDRQEVTRAAALLNPGGRLIVMSPAHQGLFSPLDEAAGHFRRYSRAGLLNLTPPETSVVEAKYLDCVGMAASLANRMMLRQGTPSEGQIHLWDRGMIPLSRLLDPVFGYRLGKSILAVWEKT